MPFASSLVGALLPVLLMLSPFMVMAARDCSDRAATGKPWDDASDHSARPRPILM